MNIIDRIDNYLNNNSDINKRIDNYLANYKEDSTKNQNRTDNVSSKKKDKKIYTFNGALSVMNPQNEEPNQSKKREQIYGFQNNNLFKNTNKMNFNTDTKSSISNEQLKEIEKMNKKLNNSGINQQINFAKIGDKAENTNKYTKNIQAIMKSNKEYNNKKAKKEVATQFAVTPILVLKGVAKDVEGKIDTMIDLSDKINNKLLNVTSNISNKEYDRRRENTRRFIADNRVENLANEYGINKILNTGEKYSLTKRDNLLGKTAEGVGGMLPTIAISRLAKIPEFTAKTLKGLTLGGKLLTLGKNIGTHMLVNSPTTASFGSKVYGGALEEAYAEGATDEQARNYAIASTAVEIASEWITGGVPGTNGVGGIDIFVDKGIDKITNQLTKSLVKYGYNVIGEGAEEILSEILNPIIKNATYSSGNTINWDDVVESFIVGGLTAGVLELPNSYMNYKQNKVYENYDEVVNQLKETKKNISDNETKTKIDNLINEINNAKTSDNDTDINKMNAKINDYINLRKQQSLNKKQKKDISKLEQKLNELQNIKNNQNVDVRDNQNKINLPTVQDIVNQEKSSQNSVNLPVYNQHSNITNSDKAILPTVNDFNSSNINMPASNIKVDMAKIKPEILEDIKGFKLGDASIESYKGSYIKTMLNEVGIKVPNAMNYVSEVRPDMSFTTTKDLTRQQYSSISNALQKLRSIDVTSVNNANYSIPIGNYQYVKSSNANINELRRTASMYLNNTARSKNTIRLLENIIKDKNYTIRFNPNITNEQGVPVNGLIKKENGKTIIELNPNADNYVEFLIVHEITHDIATKEMKELILDYAKQDSEFEKSLESLKERYKTNDVSDEVVADVCGELFGNREFIQSVVEKKPNIFKKILNNIRKLAEKIKGTGANEYVSFVEKLKIMWEDAYYSNRSNLSKTMHHLSQDALNEVDDALNNPKTDINSMVKLRDFTPEQLVSVGVNDLPMLVRKGHLRENILTSLEAKEKGYSTKGKHYHGLGIDTYMNAIDSLDNPIAVYQYTDKGNYSKDNFIVLTEVKDSDNNNIIVPIEIHKRGQYNRVEIDTNRIKTTYGRETANYFNNMVNNGSLIEIYNKKRSAKLPMQSGNFNTSTANNIPQSNNNVNSDTSSATKYSIPINKNNTQELNNGSFSLEKYKQKQLDIIKNNNTVNDDYHTWIRNIEDIKTLEETINDSDWIDYDEYNPDLSRQDIENAIDSGKIIVYSSYPIKQGIFVSPSKMEAESYSSNGKVYSKEVNINDVAWIDPTQGQYAKVYDILPTKYSQSTKEWNKYLKENFPSAGTKTKMSDIKLPIREDIKNGSKKSSILNPSEISKLTKEDANTTPILPKRGSVNKVNDGNSHFAKNIKEKVNMLNADQKIEILSKEDVRYYDKVTNKESLEKAFKKINDGGSSETLRWIKQDSKNASATDVAEGWILLKQYADNGDYDSMVEVAKKMREIGTSAGQTVQAFNIMERMTPEGMVKYAQSELSEAYDRMVKNKSKEWIDKYREDFDLKPDEVKFIMETMQEVQNMEDGYDKRVKLAEIQKLMTDKLPPEKGAKIKSWMRISMLFNPKTQVRNVAGNALIMPINSFGDLFSSYADKIIAKKTGIRTTGTTNIKAILKGMKKGAYESTNDFKKGISTRDMEGNRFEITNGKSFSEKNLIGKTLNRTESLLNYVMDVGDRVFSEAAFENSLQNQMVLNNTTEITQEMIDIAHQEALSRTWNDNNNYTKFVLGVRKGLNKLNVNGYGLGDVLIPFAKTPANLTKAIVDYSPAGLVSAINKGINLKRSLTNGQYTATMQHEFVQSLGKATAGTMLYILGIALAKAGITSGDSDDDKDTANFLKNTLGINSYSIKIGGKSFTYDWAQPLAAPLSITANVVNSKSGDSKALLEGIVGSLDSAGSILLEQSFLQSINDVLNDNDGVVSGIINEILELPARAVPTFSKQIADLVDGTQRTSFEYGKPIQSAVNSIKSKIPFVSKNLNPAVDTMGREIQKYGGKNNIFNVFLNPANVNTENISKSAEEIYRLYKKTGDQTIMPRVVSYNVKGNGEKLTSEEKAEYQKISGRIIEDNVQLLLKDNSYKEMNDTEKTEVINKIVNYSYNKAREKVLGIEMSNEYNKINSYVDDGGNVADYYLNKKEIDYSYSNPGKYKTITKITSYNDYLSYKENIDTIKEKFTNSSQRKTAVIKYVNSLDLTIPQKAMLIKMNYSSYNDYNNQIINYINKQSISLEDKKEILEELGFKVRNGKVYTK